MYNNSFMQACDNDQLLATEIIRIMSLEYPLYIAEIDRAIIADDTHTITNTLHLLKGGLAYLGFNTQSLKLSSLTSPSSKLTSEDFSLLYQPIRSFLLNLPYNLALELNSSRQV